MVEDSPSKILALRNWLPFEAGHRLVEAAGLPLAPGVTVDKVRDGLGYSAVFAISYMTAPIDKSARRDLERSRKALAKYDEIMRDLESQGIRVPGLPDQWLEGANEQIESLLKHSGNQRRKAYIRGHVYPFLLALYELSFAKTPTAYFYNHENRDGPTLAFVRQAAAELDNAHSSMFERVPGATSLLGGSNGGTLEVSFPDGDSLRRSLEPLIMARRSKENINAEPAETDSTELIAYRTAYNLLRFRVFRKE